MPIESTRTASVLLAFGFFFFISCSTKLNHVETALSSYEEERYEEALSSLNRSLEEDPANHKLLLLKGETLQQLALQRNEPGERLPYYRDMRRTLQSIGPESPNQVLNQKSELITTSWNHEHLAGAELFLELGDQSASEQDRILDHLQNAIEISPGSKDTYAVKAAFHYQNGELNRAVATLEQAKEALSDLPSEMEEKYAFLLLEEGEIQRAINIYSDLAQQHPDQEQIRHGLVNAYILDGQHDKSIELLRELVEAAPDNIAYHQALATELFFHLQQLVDHVRQDSEPVQSNDLYLTLENVLEEAEHHYQVVMEHHPGSDEVTFVTAAFYKNSAQQLIRLSENRDLPFSDQLEEKALELLTRSVPVWQQLAETNPESSDIWRNMYQIYSMLGMSDEAEEAGSKVNF